MSKQPLFEAARGALLTGEIVPREQLTVADRAAMYALLSRYFQSTDQATFNSDLDEKEQVILLRERATGLIQGFSTLMRLQVVHEGRPVYAVFSGDTIIDARFWGESLLIRLWLQAAFGEADRLTSKDPAAEVYWFLICSGYKTFRFLPVFFREFYPHPTSGAAAALKPLLDAFSSARYGEQYDPASGVIRLRDAAPLRDGIAEITAQRLRDPMVQFFAERNPEHARGDELACLTRIARDNITAACRRLLHDGAALQSPASSLAV